MEEMKPTPPATREVKRYMMCISQDWGSKKHTVAPVETSTGEWVKYSDHASTLAAMREALEAAESKKRTACGVADELGVRLRAMKEDLKTLAAEVQIHREPITDTGHHERWRKLKIAMTETDASGALTRAKENP